MPTRPCLGSTLHRPGHTLTDRAGSRCPACAAAVEARRTPRPTSQTRTWAERQRRKAVVDAHRELRGNWCPGWQRPPHETTDLTADHIHAVGAGGEQAGPLRALCRSCNGSKQTALG